MADKDILMPFSGHTGEDLANVFRWLVDVHKDYGMSVEALDAFLSEYKETGDLGKAMWFANCEWDL